MQRFNKCILLFVHCKVYIKKDKESIIFQSNLNYDNDMKWKVSSILL